MFSLKLLHGGVGAAAGAGLPAPALRPRPGQRPRPRGRGRQPGGGPVAGLGRHPSLVSGFSPLERSTEES